MCRHNNFNALRTPHVPATPLPFREWAGLAPCVQFARKMGCARGDWGGPDKEHLAQKFGAHIYIDAKAQDAAAALQKLEAQMSSLRPRKRGRNRSLLPALKLGANLCCRVSADAIPSRRTAHLRRTVSFGSLTEERSNSRHADFSVLTDVRPMIETLPLQRAEEAYKRMMDGQGTLPSGAHYHLNKFKSLRQNGAQTERPRGRLG